MVTTWKTKNVPSKFSAWKSKKENVSEVVTEKKEVDNARTEVSVFTKTTNPKVIIQSENVDSSGHCQKQSFCGHKVLKTICLIILGIVVLINFFLALKTYNIINELYLLLSN